MRALLAFAGCAALVGCAPLLGLDAYADGEPSPSPGGAGGQGGTAADDDLDGEPGPLWIQAWPGSGDDAARSVARTDAGELIVAGVTGAELTVGGSELDVSRGEGLFVATLTPSGTPRWAKLLATADAFVRVRVAATVDRVAVAGCHEGTLTSGGRSSAARGTIDGFAIVLDAEGAPVAEPLHLAGADEDCIEALALVQGDPQSLLLAGWHGDDANLAGASLEHQGGSDAFAAHVKIDEAAVTVLGAWHNEGTVRATALAATADGVWLAGDFEGTLAIDGRGTVSSMGRDGWVASQRWDGTPNWMVALPGDGDDEPLALAVRGEAPPIVVVAGRTGSALGPGAGGVDAFALLLDGEGASIGMWQGGSADDDSATAVAIHGQGSVGVVLAGVEASGAGATNFVRELSVDAVEESRIELGVASALAAPALTADGNTAFFAGAYSGTLSLGSTEHSSSAGSLDPLVAGLGLPLP